MSSPSVVFLINLLQDVNVLRPLVYLASRETNAKLRFLVTSRFGARDLGGVWTAEVASLAGQVGAEVTSFSSLDEAFIAIQGGWGVLLAASESDLPAHREVHEVFRAAPPGYLKVTLQHGLECVGFLQNREHVLHHGDSITFAADVLCAWLEPERLLSLHSSQRAKVFVTGPTSLITRPVLAAGIEPVKRGLVCENLHSVRLRASDEHWRPFMDTFNLFCDVLAAIEENVTLRPHPAGQYVLKNKVELPTNVILNNLPMYRVNLAEYDWGISAPSTVVLDMVLAGVPVGVWQDPDGVMDLSTYNGLMRVSGLEDWLGLVRDARARPQVILDRQRRWLRGLGMPLDPGEVYRRYTQLINSGTRQAIALKSGRRRGLLIDPPDSRPC